MSAGEQSPAFLDWERAAPPPVSPRRQPPARGGRTRPVVAASIVLGLLIAPFGIAATGDVLREGVRNGTTTAETEIIGRIDATRAAKGGYVTRQSNTRTGARAGGAAIYGCRAPAGGTAAGSAACLRASNLAGGNAFEFATSSGPAGLFDPGAPTDPPFAVTGTGLVTGLNADKLDGRDASELAGAQGPTGPQGPAGATNVRIRTANFLSNGLGYSGFQKLSCNAGERAVGGGIGWTQSPGGGDATHFSAPWNGTDDVYAAGGEVPTGWVGLIETSDGAGKEGRIYAVCASP